MKNINGQTQVYGILGNPISHSLSPLFQNHFLEKADVNACYLPYLVNPEQLEQTLHGLHAAHVQGLNITIPHKENILSLVRSLKRFNRSAQHPECCGQTPSMISLLINTYLIQKLFMKIFIS